MVETGGAVAGVVGRASWKVARAGGGVVTTIGKGTGKAAGKVSLSWGGVIVLPPKVIISKLLSQRQIVLTTTNQTKTAEERRVEKLSII